MASYAVPVPKMLVRRDSKEPTGLYRIKLGGEQGLVAETTQGYVGCSMLCPHRGSRLELYGTVLPNVPAVVCRSHAISYSLEDGECLENLSGEVDEPGVLTTFEVRREGDVFVATLAQTRLGSQPAGECTGCTRQRPDGRHVLLAGGRGGSDSHPDGANADR